MEDYLFSFHMIYKYYLTYDWFCGPGQHIGNKKKLKVTTNEHVKQMSLKEIPCGALKKIIHWIY